MTVLKPTLFGCLAAMATAGVLLTGPSSVVAAPVEVSPSGAVSVPTMAFPSSQLMSKEGNASRVEHIQEKRRLQGMPTEAFYAALFGPGLERAEAAYAVSIRKDVIGGVKVLVYEPKSGVAKKNAHRVLINVHGGGFQACFQECGGMESIPIVAQTGMRVISIDYREGPTAHYPAATEDVLAVYRQVLKTYPARHVGLFGCSAGGTLTAQTLAALPRHGLPEPVAAGIYCAGGDAGRGGDSVILGNLLGDGEAPSSGAGSTGGAPLGYMAGASPDDPEAFPANHPEVLKLFPPTLVVTGTRDFASSSAIYLHSKLVENGVDARLHVWEGGRHAFFYDVRVPESRQATKVMAAFFDSRVER